MSARVCSPPSLIDRVTSNVSTAEALGDSSLPLPSSRTSHTDPGMIFFGKRFGGSPTSPLSTSLPTSVQMTKLRGVSRNLFGSPNPASAQYARDKLKEMRREESKRWNFDFEAEKPLPGRYVWVPVESTVTSASSFHPSSPVDVLSTSGSGSSSTGSTLPTLPISSTGPSEPKQRRLETEPSEPLLIVRPVPVITSTLPSPNPVVSSIPQQRKTPVPPKHLFPMTPGGVPSGQSQPKIPPNVLVKSSAVDPLDGEGGRKYLKTDSSSRPKPKQIRITTMYGSAIKKRRIGRATATAEKKAAF